MILEIALLEVKTGFEASFEKDFEKAGQYISSVDGYRSHSLRKCMEQPNKYLLQVQWRRLEDHTVGFRQSAAYQEWKSMLHHYYEPFPEVEHYEAI